MGFEVSGIFRAIIWVVGTRGEFVIILRNLTFFRHFVLIWESIGKIIIITTSILIISLFLDCSWECLIEFRIYRNPLDRIITLAIIIIIIVLYVGSCSYGSALLRLKVSK